MRRIHPQELSARTMRMLAGRTKKVLEAKVPAAKAKSLWNSKTGKSWEEIKGTLRTMASGVERCMYCEDSEGTDIEHFYPKSVYPEYAYDWDNYLLACSRCNSNYKRDLFPLDDDGRPLLILPTGEEPTDYLEYSPSAGQWVALDDEGVGEASKRVYGLDRDTLVRGRQAAWHAYQSAIIRYDEWRTAGSSYADGYFQALQTLPFSSIFAAIVRFAADTSMRGSLDPAVPSALERRPEIAALFEPPT